MAEKAGRSSTWSFRWILLTAIISFLSLLWEWSIEDAVTTLLFVGMSFVELNVCRRLRKGEWEAAKLGIWNQVTFAIYFIVWGVIRIMTPYKPSPELTGLVDTTIIEHYLRLSYCTIGIAGALGQLAVAYYYWRISLRQAENLQ